MRLFLVLLLALALLLTGCDKNVKWLQTMQCLQAAADLTEDDDRRSVSQLCLDDWLDDLSERKPEAEPSAVLPR